MFRNIYHTNYHVYHTIRYHSKVQSPKYTKHAFLVFSFIDIMSSRSFLLIFYSLSLSLTCHSIYYVLTDLISLLVHIFIPHIIIAYHNLYIYSIVPAKSFLLVVVSESFIISSKKILKN